MEIAVVVVIFIVAIISRLGRAEIREREEILRVLRRSPGRKMYGLEMIKEGNGHIRRGSVYVHLQRLEEEGLVASELAEEREQALAEGRRFPRRRYWAVEPS